MMDEPKPEGEDGPGGDSAVPKKREFGQLRGQFSVPDDFDTMFQKEIEEMFYGPDEGGEDAPK